MNVLSKDTYDFRAITAAGMMMDSVSDTAVPDTDSASDLTVEGLSSCWRNSGGSFLWYHDLQIQDPKEESELHYKAVIS